MKFFMWKAVVTCLATVFLGLFSSTALFAGADPVTISYITFIDRNHEALKIMQKVFDEIEKRSDGQVKFNNKGGPEAVKLYNQTLNVYQGSTDMVFTTPSFMGKFIKGAEMITMCELPVSKQKECGLYDYMNSVLKDKKLHFLQMYPSTPGESYVIISKKPITKFEDFKGMSGRGGDWMDGVAPAFGISTVSLKHFEEYSALEKGIIDYGRMTLDSMYAYRLHEVAKYLILPTFGMRANSWFMNLDKWNSIPENLQNIIEDTMYEMADQVEADLHQSLENIKKNMVADGMEICELQGVEREKYLKALHDGMFQYFSKDNPEVARKIYDLTRK